MRLIDLDEFLRQNCIDRMEGKSCEECKHHVLEVSCERLMEQPTAEKVGKWIRHPEVKNIYGGVYIECSECREKYVVQYVEDEKFCRNCGARMDVPDNDVGETEGEEG